MIYAFYRYRPNCVASLMPWDDASAAAGGRRGGGPRPPRCADTVLIRPDGYVAWAGGTEAGLREALLAWFGRPRVPAAVTG